MYETIKSYLQTVGRYSWVYIVIGVIFLFACVWFFADRNSNIDTTGISKAKSELGRVSEYQRKSVEYNHEARNDITDSLTINQRLTERIDRSQELTNRTEEAIRSGQDEVRTARDDAERARGVISESRGILERAAERATESEGKATEKQCNNCGIRD